MTQWLWSYWLQTAHHLQMFLQQLSSYHREGHTMSWGGCYSQGKTPEHTLFHYQWHSDPSNYLYVNVIRHDCLVHAEPWHAVYSCMHYQLYVIHIASLAHIWRAILPLGRYLESEQMSYKLNRPHNSIYSWNLCIYQIKMCLNMHLYCNHPCIY